MRDKNLEPAAAAAGPATFTAKAFDELSVHELYDLLQLRIQVFAVEQNCVYQDLDGIDLRAQHLMGRAGGEIVACARWFEHPRGLALGRIVTKLSHRRTGLGRALMRAALERIGERTIVMHAQSYLEAFYRSFGFEVEGEPFSEDGIPHLLMYRPAGGHPPSS
jgi:ElaA protein